MRLLENSGAVRLEGAIIIDIMHAIWKKEAKQRVARVTVDSKYYTARRDNTLPIIAALRR